MNCRSYLLTLCFVPFLFECCAAASSEDGRTMDCVFRFGGYKGIALLGMDANVEHMFMNEPLDEARKKYMPEIDFAWREWNWRLYVFERAFYTSNTNDMKNAVNNIIEGKRMIAKLHRRGSRSYCCYMLSLEYSLARLLQERLDEVQSQVVREGEDLLAALLQDEDFDLIAKTKEYAQSAFSLRNMIHLAMRIEAFRRERRVLPTDLAAVRTDKKYLLDGYGRPIAYTVNGDTWLLYSAGSRNESDAMPFDVYVPHVLFSDHNGFRKTLPLWFSPSFSSKRWQWYQSRSLYDGTPYEYKMPDWWR